VVQRIVGGVEPPGPVAPVTYLGEHQPVRGDIGLGQPWRDPPQPCIDGVVITPGHRNQAEWRSDGEALPDGVLAIGAVADGVDGNQVRLPDLGHRAARAQRRVQKGERIAAAIQQRELRSQPVYQPEQSAAQRVAAIFAPGHPVLLFEFGQH
jgi:hypothetical protein